MQSLLTHLVNSLCYIFKMMSVYVQVAVLSVFDLCVLQDTLCLKLALRKNLMRGTTFRRKLLRGKQEHVPDTCALA